MTVAGLIFSNIHDSAIPELTNRRTMASVPFGCRYRLVDFPISNMVNSGITKVGIITHNNYQSLMDHIGTGKDWDLARRSGGIKIIPPFITAYENSAAARLYSTRLEALMGAFGFISRCTEEYIAFSDCDGICNIDLSDVLQAHEKNDADITIVTRRISPGDDVSQSMYIVSSDDKGEITDVSAYHPSDVPVQISTNIMVMKRTFLINMISDAEAHGYTDFYRDIICRNCGRYRMYSYNYDGFYIMITSLASYFSASMKLLDADMRNGLFNVRNRPIYTKVRNSSPTIYSEKADVKNSYVADGCIIDGKVENSILFRGVHVGKGTVVRNSVLLQDTFTGDDVMLNCVISDKNVVIKNGRMLSGHETMPFFLSKGTIV